MTRAFVKIEIEVHHNEHEANEGLSQEKKNLIQFLEEKSFSCDDWFIINNRQSDL